MKKEKEKDKEKNVKDKEKGGKKGDKEREKNKDKEGNRWSKKWAAADWKGYWAEWKKTPNKRRTGQSREKRTKRKNRTRSNPLSGWGELVCFPEPTPGPPLYTLLGGKGGRSTNSILRTKEE